MEVPRRGGQNYSFAGFILLAAFGTFPWKRIHPESSRSSVNNSQWHPLLYSSTGSKRKPGAKSPSQELIQAIVEMKQQNPRFGYPRIAQQINNAFGRVNPRQKDQGECMDTALRRQTNRNHSFKPDRPI